MAVWLSAAPSQASGAQAIAPVPRLTEIRQILQLSSEEAGRKVPVRVQATVTLSDKEFNLLFVQDATAGIYVHGLSPDIAVTAGQSFLLEGVTGPGLLSPIIDQATVVSSFEEGPDPKPHRTALGELGSGQADGQFVETEGIVLFDETLGGRRHLQIGSGLNRCEVWVLEHTEKQAPSLVDARVQIRGVCAAEVGRHGRPTEFRLYARRTADIVVAEPVPENAFTMPPIPARDLLTSTAMRLGEHRLRVQGVVTLHWPGERLVIQDGSGGIRLLESSKTNRWRVGEVVDAAGFRTPVSASAQLEWAVVRPTRTVNQTLKPLVITHPLRSDLDNRLVQLDVELLHASAATSGLMTLSLWALDQCWTALVLVGDAGSAEIPGLGRFCASLESTRVPNRGARLVPHLSFGSALQRISRCSPSRGYGIGILK